DIVLGDRFGTSCSPLLTGLVEHHLRACGFKVLRNKPYAGGFITEHYGEPGIGRHALQIEINRGLYMNEGSLALTDGFSKLVWHLREMVVAVAGEITDLTPRRIAAE